jgi:hypothetical protein
MREGDIFGYWARSPLATSSKPLPHHGNKIQSGGYIGDLVEHMRAARESSAFASYPSCTAEAKHQVPVECFPDSIGCRGVRSDERQAVYGVFSCRLKIEAVYASVSV